MMFKAVVLCAFALSVQSIAGLSCYRPPVSLPSCGCNSGSVTVTVSEQGSGQSCYQPIPAPCSSTRKTIGISEGNSYQSIGASSGSLASSYRSGSGCQSISIPSSGGALAITAIGPIAPSGIAVATDLGLAGDLVLSGTLPYLSAVAFDGQFATSGAVPVSYGCGDCVAITEQLGGNVGSGPVNVNLGCGCKY